MARSHGQRSSSVRGWPAAILATLAAEWNASPSAYVQPSTADRPLATVDLPTPETPITITCGAASRAAMARDPTREAGARSLTRRGDPGGRDVGASVGSASVAAMPEVHRLSRQDARRLALRAQLLAGERPTDLVAMVDRLTALPVDMTAAVATAPDLVSWARLGVGVRAVRPRGRRWPDATSTTTATRSARWPTCRSTSPTCRPRRRGRAPATGSRPTSCSATRCSTSSTPTGRCCPATSTPPPRCRGGRAGGTPTATSG